LLVDSWVKSVGAGVVLPFVIAGVTVLHLALLHKDGSNNPLGVDSGVDKVPFYPYFFVKDLFAFFTFLFFFAVAVGAGGVAVGVTGTDGTTRAITSVPITS